MNGIPHLIDINNAESSDPLKRIYLGYGAFNEDWLQNIIYINPSLIPINEIEPAFSELIPLCRELPLDSGFLDNLYVNANGMLTIVECKLWKNPESRRKVIGQILDYAKDISNQDYESLESKIKKITSKTIIEIVSSACPDVNESSFIDNIEKNIRLGRFLLIIIGDGIHENMHKISAFLDKYAKLQFTFSLVEMQIIRMNDNRILVIPQTLSTTYEIGRFIIYDKPEETITVMQNAAQNSKKTRTTISEQQFFEDLAENQGDDVANKLRNLLYKFRDELNFKLSTGTNSISLKDIDSNYNFSTFFSSGDVKQFGCVTKAEQFGNLSLGDNYLESLSKLIPGSEVNRKNDKWYWRITKQNKTVNVIDYLNNQDGFIDLVLSTKTKLDGITQ